MIDKKKTTLTDFKVVLERFMLARQKYMTTHTSLAALQIGLKEKNT